VLAGARGQGYAITAMARPYYITTAISYPNDVPHIGHAYEAIATDALARFRRLQGMDVFFLTGTDEHGVKMLQTAKKQGITPAELADRNTPRFEAWSQALDCSNDDFHPHAARSATSAPAKSCGGACKAQGDIYLDKYAGWYSVRDEAYYDESELKETLRARSCRRKGRRSSGSRRRAYFFRPVGLPGEASRPLRGASGVHRS
jgi:methionyl-tRNA synthetase